MVSLIPGVPSGGTLRGHHFPAQPEDGKWHKPTTPYCMIVAEGDHLVPSGLAIDAFEDAKQPKRLVILPGGHFDAYTDGFEGAGGAATDWFVEHLNP